MFRSSAKENENQNILKLKLENKKTVTNLTNKNSK